MSTKGEKLGKAIGIIVLAAVVAYLLYKFIFNLREKTTEVWTCGNCGFILRKRYDKCPRCGVCIKWE